MAPFAHENQIGEFDLVAVTFCVQVYEDGDVPQSIVTDAGSHGTHVAGIVANLSRMKNRHLKSFDVAPGVLLVKIGATVARDQLVLVS
jgi:subtilisin family serine protease